MAGNIMDSLFCKHKHLKFPLFWPAISSSKLKEELQFMFVLNPHKVWGQKKTDFDRFKDRQNFKKLSKSKYQRLRYPDFSGF